MGPLGFFNADKRLEALPVEAIDRLVPSEGFRAEIEAVVLTPFELKKSSAGRKPFDAMLMFRMLVLQALNNLSDEQLEYQVRGGCRSRAFLRSRSRTAVRTPRALDDAVTDAAVVRGAPCLLGRRSASRLHLISRLRAGTEDD